MRVNKFIFIETGTYSDMHHRPYSLQFDQNQLNAVYDATNGGASITPTTIAEPLAGVATPSATVSNQVQIPQGWGSKRFAFMLEIEHSIQGMTVYDVMSGYTDHADVTIHRTIDPNMRLYINSMTRVRTRHMPTPHGMIEVPSPVKTSQVLNDLTQSNTMFGSEPKFTVRPEDVFFVVGGGHVNENGNILSTPSTTFAMGAKTATRSETSSTTYMASILNAFAQYFGQLDPNHDTYADVSFEAARSVTATGINNNTLINNMQMATNVARDGYFTFNQLLQACPDAWDRLHTVYSDNNLMHGYSSPQDSQHMNGADPTTVAATMLANTLSALMSDALLTDLVIDGTNCVVGHHEPYMINIQNAVGFSDKVDVRALNSRLVNRIKVELMPTLTHNGLMSVSFHASVRLMYETRIRISLNGGPMVDYCVPTFSDGLFSPLITEGDGDLTNLSAAMDSMARSIGIVGNSGSIPVSVNQGVETPYPSQNQPTTHAHQPVHSPMTATGSTSTWR